MAEKDDKQYAKLKAQSDQLKIALESVPSEDIARELLMDKIQDAFLIKIKVAIENRVGIVMILISTYNKKILTLYSVAGNTKTLSKAKSYEDHKRFMQDFLEISTEEGIDLPLSESIGRAAYYTLPEPTIIGQMGAWNKKDLRTTLQLFEQNIIKQTNIQTVTLEGDVEKISSIKIRFNSVLEGKVNPIPPPQAETPPAETENVPKKPFEEYMESIIQNYSRAMKVKTLISPSEGAEYSGLVKGEIIYFKPPFETDEDKQTVQELGLILPDGKLGSMEGKFLNLINSQGEYHIFAEGPEKLLLHSVETQRVKIQVKNRRTQKLPAIEEKKKESELDMTIVIGGVIGIAVVALVFFFLLYGK